VKNLPPLLGLSIEKVFVHFSAKVRANLDRKKSCLLFGDMAFSPVPR
jgi:hypothetical protein